MKDMFSSSVAVLDWLVCAVGFGFLAVGGGRLSGGCSTGLGGVGGFGFAGVDVAVGCCIDLDGDERRRVFAGGGLVGDFTNGAVVPVRTSGTEVAPVGFRSVFVCVFRQLSSLTGAEEGVSMLDKAGSSRFLFLVFLDFLVDGARRFQVMTTLTVVSWRSV